MKKVLLVAACVLSLASALAVPARRTAVQTAQPDGTTVTLQLNGDEFYHFTTTTDGYTVLQNEQGAYEYARRVNGRLVTTGVMAHDASLRSAGEQALLSGLGKNLTDTEAVAGTKPLRAQRDASALSAKLFDQSKFRGLIILINFKDRKFSRNDANDLYSKMASQKNYTGYTNEDGTTNYYGSLFDGSVRDYYYDQSMGQFDPIFDVVGPVEVNYNSTQCGSNSRTIFQAALRAADSQVDYSKYDGDGDGKVDMVFFLVAGWGAHVQGNSSNLLWPHKSTALMPTSKLDGKSFDLYACSTEMLGSQGSTILDGIGTICHEFGHVLGLPDFYDTDYDGSGGTSHHPGSWDIMAGGSDNNFGRTPVGYTIFERYALGWANPPVIRETGSYTLNAVNTSNEGYIIKTPNRSEYFILDNRQLTGWDRYLPGHGMIVTRVDSASAYIWITNDINNNPNRNYYELLRAGNTASGDLASDPFPGTMGITRINNDTKPSLRTWSQQENSWKIENIRENGGVITFELLSKGDEVPAAIEDFEGMAVTSGTQNKGIEGVFATWDFTKSNVKEPGQDLCFGSKAVEMIYPSQFTSATPVYYNIREVSFNVFNAAATASKFGLSYSLDDGKTWTKAKNVTGSDAITVPSSTNTVCTWLVPVDNTQPVRFRVIQNSGGKNGSYIDNFAIYYTGEPGGPTTVKGDVNGDDVVDIADINEIINVMLGKGTNAKADVTGDGVTDIGDINTVINIMLGKG